jgi:hypothetical protein
MLDRNQFEQALMRLYVKVDFELPPPYKSKTEYAIVRAKNTSEESERAIVGIVQSIKNAADNIEFYHGLKRLRGELGEFDPFSSIENSLIFGQYGILLANEIRKERELERKIFSILEQVPEFFNTEPFASLVENRNGHISNGKTTTSSSKI